MHSVYQPAKGASQDRYGWMAPDENGDYHPVGSPRITFEDAGNAKRPTPHLEDLSPNAQARRARAKAARLWQTNKERDETIRTCLVELGWSIRKTASFMGISKGAVQRVKARIMPTGKLRMYAEK